jgi:hypothetical protein
MSRFTDMLAQAPETRSAVGVVDRWVQTLEDDDREAFLQAVNDPSIPTVTITQVMRRLGYNGGRSTFDHWRTAQCRK